MPLAYFINVTIHVLAALFWLGGMLFVGLVGAPVLRRIEPAALRQKVFHELGTRFVGAGWTAIGVLVVTGLLNLHYRGWLRWDGVFGSSAFWGTSLGHALAWKLVTVIAMIVVSAMHDFVLGPAAGRAEPGSQRAIALRRRAALLARVNAVLGIVVVAAAVRLARGG
jgi:uncharacterized membrane protein